jgi:hypothetical protein
VRSPLRRWSLYVLAWFCLLIAALSFVIPFLPTTGPIIIGLVILSTEYAWAHRWLEKFKKKFPKVGGMVLKVETWIHGGPPPAPGADGE